MFEIEEIVYTEDDEIRKRMIKSSRLNTGFDEKKAMDLLKKKRVNKPKKKITKSKYKNVEGSYRNNAKNYQYDYEEDFYEPENR